MPGSVSATLAADIAERQPLRYAGYCYDAESGTYYCSARSYDPETMQFLQKDPARADGEESAYQYCGGDPVGKVDPSGEVARLVTVILAAAVAALTVSTYMKFKRFMANNEGELLHGYGHWISRTRPSKWRHLNRTCDLFYDRDYWHCSSVRRMNAIYAAQQNLDYARYVILQFKSDFLCNWIPVM